MYIMPARWGFQGVIAQERMAVATSPAWVMDLHKPDTTAPDNFVFQGKFHCAEAQMASLDFNGAWGFADYDKFWLPPVILLVMTLLTFLAILVILKRRDSV
jgi:hypothetical protein